MNSSNSLFGSAVLISIFLRNNSSQTLLSINTLIFITPPAIFISPTLRFPLRQPNRQPTEHVVSLPRLPVPFHHHRMLGGNHIAIPARGRAGEGFGGAEGEDVFECAARDRGEHLVGGLRRDSG